jgi:hypothetical protein
MSIDESLREIVDGEDLLISPRNDGSIKGVFIQSKHVQPCYPVGGRSRGVGV